MKRDLEQHWRRQLVWGLVLIFVGIVFLLDRFDMLDLDVDLGIAHIWHYWPVLVAVFGVSKMIPPTTPRLFLNGLGEVFFAAWWYVSFEHVWGLTFVDTWPALLIMWGIRIVLRPALEKQFLPQQEN